MPLNLRYDGQLSNTAFKFNLRRYTEAWCFSTVNMNNFMDASALQVIIEQPLEKKSGRGLQSFSSQLNLSAFMGQGVRLGVV
jgi:hypothetical protein